MNPIELLQELVSAHGPAGQEEGVRVVLAKHLKTLGLSHETDPKGNLIVRVGPQDGTPIVITAHMDEIGMLVREIKPDGSLMIKQHGGIYPWKLGEGPVEILARDEVIPGVFGFGGIHTEDPQATSVKARTKAVDWEMGSVFTGLSAEDLAAKGVRPGTRVVVAQSRRQLTQMGDHVAGYFLDDRADMVSWLLVLEKLKDSGKNLAFVATASEEVGGEGALYFLQRNPADVCIALELGALVPDAKVELIPNPTVWSTDGYAATSPADLELLDVIAKELSMPLQYQAFSRGGSDASCSASHGLCARPITLGLPIANSHGYEIMHKDAMTSLADLTVALIAKL